MHCIQKTNVRNTLHMQDFWWWNVHPLWRSRYIFQGHVISCRWQGHVWQKGTVSISVYIVSNLIWVFMKIMTSTSLNFIENLLAKPAWAMLWMLCEECYVNEQYWREQGRSQFCNSTDILRSWSKHAVCFINKTCCCLSL